MRDVVVWHHRDELFYGAVVGDGALAFLGVFGEKFSDPSPDDGVRICDGGGGGVGLRRVKEVCDDGLRVGVVPGGEGVKFERRHGGDGWRVG